MPFESRRLAELADHDAFIKRHNGPSPDDVATMLKALNMQRMEDLIEQTVPSDIRLGRELALDDPRSEAEALEYLSQLARQNRVSKSYIGQGYYNTHMPAVIQRNVLENPGWYTAYTPYQPEISQGRLEGLLNFQQVIMDLTGMELANASLLDEATAAAEAMGEVNARACTDVTGFGLLGHARNIAKASAVTLSFDAGALPIFEGALALAREALDSGAAAQRLEDWVRITRAAAGSA